MILGISAERQLLPLIVCSESQHGNDKCFVCNGTTLIFTGFWKVSGRQLKGQQQEFEVAGEKRQQA